MSCRISAKTPMWMRPRASGDSHLPALYPLEHHVAAVPGVRPHLARPAPLIHRLGPGRAEEHLGTLNLVERAVPGLILDHHGAALPAHDHGHGPALEARDGDDTGHRQEQRHVLLVVDLIEERLLLGLHVHGRAEEIPGLDRHGQILPRVSGGFTAASWARARQLVVEVDG